MPKILKSFVPIVAFAVAAMAQIQLPITQAPRTPSPNAPSGSCFTQTLPVYDYVLAKYWYCVPNTTPPTNLGKWTTYSLPTGVLAMNASGQLSTATSAQIAAVQTTTGTGTTFVLQGSPTLTTPNLGTPSAVVLTNATGTPSGAGVTLSVVVPLTLSQLQTLNSVGVQVLAAPGATSMYMMGPCTLNLTHGSAAFTGGGTVSIGYGTQASVLATHGTIASTVFTTFASSHLVTVEPVAQAVTATTSYANLGIWMIAASADFAVGTGASGQLSCQYSIITGVQ